MSASDQKKIISDDKFLTFKHSGFCGDVVYAIAGIRSLYNKTGKRARLLIRLDTVADSYPGAIHPQGMVLMNSTSFALLRPLLLAQKCIAEVGVYSGQKVDADLDSIREISIGMPYGNIMRWLFYRFPDMHCDLTEKWLQLFDVYVNAEVKSSIVVNLTGRFRNPWVDYYFLEKQYTDVPVYFIGLPDEFMRFAKMVPHAKLMPVNDFNHMAAIIAQCRLFIGNQSLAFAIAEGLKVRRLLEVCPFAPNVISSDAQFFDFWKQDALEYYVRVALG
ncbi:MAG: hypothetical protein ACHQNT_13405 [Bacteroidia bacterium]